MVKAKYEKIAEKLKKDIESGRLHANSKLPKTTDLAKFFDVSYVTMSNAIQLLSESGHITAIQGNGIFINSPALSGLRKKDIFWLAPIAGDLYGRCFRAAQDALYDTEYRLIPVDPEKFNDIAMQDSSKATKILAEYCKSPIIIEGTRHFPFSLLKKINPSGRGIYFMLHCECMADEFPEAVKITPDFRHTGFIAAQKLHESGAERFFILSYEDISDKEKKIAGNPPFTYEKLIHDGMNDYAQQNLLPSAEIFHTFNDYIADFDRLKPLAAVNCGFMAIGDSRAYTLYRYAKVNNITIGQNWHVAGLGKTDWCSIMEPNLQSISMCEIDIARMLVSEIINNNFSKNITVKTHF